MLRKMILVAVVGGLAVAAFKGTKWASYVRAELCSMREDAENAVPPEKEIARLRGEIRLLDEDTLKIVKQLARLQSDQADLVKRQEVLTKKKDDVAETMKSREALVRAAEEKARAGEGNVAVTFGDQRLSLDMGKARLKATVQQYADLTKELTLTAAKVNTQQRIVDKLERQRLQMSGLKGELDAAVDALEADVQDLKLQQMESKYQTDDTRVAQIKESIAKQRKRLDVQRRELTLLQDTDAPVAGPAESVDEIMAPVTGTKAAAKPTTVPKAD